ncbi:MAG: hypothetical protein HYV63_16790 [Candidatus Schekmanbacteria bacterium]|nr:hypothetical protein [Candidatus Schekmanbacteria bacterium]
MHRAFGRASRVEIVLCRPADERNVGSAIRAAANFGLAEVTIVGLPSQCEEDALERFSSGASACLRVRFAASVAAAVEGCELVLGTSRRRRGAYSPPVVPSARLGELVAPASRVAVLFGNERSGLSSAEVKCCSALIRLPAHQRFASVNLSHAVACIGYELARESGGGPPHDQDGADTSPRGPEPGVAERASVFARGPRPASVHESETFYQCVEALCATGASPPGAGGEVFARQLRRILERAAPSAKELSFLLGVLKRAMRTG